MGKEFKISKFDKQLKQILGYHTGKKNIEKICEGNCVEK